MPVAKTVVTGREPALAPAAEPAERKGWSRVVASLVRKATGNAVVLAHLPAQRRVAYAPRARIEALRDARIAAVVRHAARFVPYYRDAFRRLGIDPRSIASAKDLERLPILDKDELVADPDRFVSESRRGRTSIPFISSGSSGKSARVHHDRRSLLANIAYGERERAVLVELLGRELRYREASVGYPAGTIRKVRAFYREATSIVRPARLNLSVLSPLRETVERLNAFRPDVIVVFGNYLAALSRAVARGELELVPPKVFIYGAEGLRREVRREIEATFGVPVISYYSAVETFKLGFLCEAREGFHVHEDLCHVRILREDGTDAAAGERGQVVISNLVNRGTVLLNYRLGDVASFADAACSCGRTFRLLDDVDGRVEDILEVPDGRILHPRAIWGVIKPYAEVLQYQLVEEEPNAYVLRLVMRADDYPNVAPVVAREIEELLGSAARVRTERHEKLAADGSGKVRLVVALPRRSSP